MSSTEYPPLHVQDPRGSEHVFTFIFLHGRSSSGPEVCESLFEGKPSSNKSISQAVPKWRFVFPSAKEIMGTTFQEEEDSWFDIVSLTDIENQSELQVEGLQSSVRYLLGVLEDEVSKVGARNVVPGGISMGMATALWVLLCRGHASGKEEDVLGGFIGFSGWLPFASGVKKAMQDTTNVEDALDPTSDFMRSTISLDENVPNHPQLESSQVSSPVRAPIFLGHGRDDVWVDVSLGKQVLDVLREGLQLDVTFTEYEGAEQEGHWIKEPEGIDDLVDYLRMVEANS
ncbi:hypothetical protein MMC25_001403 [Agyrium rufum]|nr:hypothetical protein [Agyrium rufum]